MNGWHKRKKHYLNESGFGSRIERLRALGGGKVSTYLEEAVGAPVPNV